MDIVYMAKSAWTALLDAIRSKGGTSALMTAAQAKAAVDAIQTGGGDYVADDWLDVTKPVGEIVSSVSDLSIVTFKRHTGITRLVLQSATEIPGHFCNGCTNLTEVIAPNVTKVGGSAFMNTKALNSPCFFPKASLVTDAFNGSSVPVVVANAIDTSNSRIIYNNPSLIAVDMLGTRHQNLNGGSVFANCASFKTLILRDSTMLTLSGIASFGGTPFASGKSGGTLYVPAALVESYQTATNWSIILSYANNQILPIEGSIYETQYADGTPIPTT